MTRTMNGTEAAVDMRLTLRRPTAVERAARAMLCLTAREDAILAALSLHRFLTVAHLERAFFPPAGQERRSHCVHAYQRVRLLWLWGYLHRSELARRPGRGGRPPALWSLAPAGARHVAALRLAERPVAHSPRPDRISPLFLTHDLQAAWCWASLHALVQRGRLSQLRWLSEPRLRARHTKVADPTSGRRLAVLPDAYFELAYPDGRVQCAMLEVDMDSVPDDDFKDKLVALETYRCSGHFACDYDRAAFETFIVACSEERRKRLWTLGRDTVPAVSRRWYSFATFAALAPGCLDETLWHTLADEHTGLLYD